MVKELVFGELLETQDTHLKSINQCDGQQPAPEQSLVSREHPLSMEGNLTSNATSLNLNTEYLSTSLCLTPHTGVKTTATDLLKTKQLQLEEQLPLTYQLYVDDILLNKGGTSEEHRTILDGMLKLLIGTGMQLKATMSDSQPSTDYAKSDITIYYSRSSIL